MKQSENFYLTIYHQIQEGKRPSQIKGLLNISKENLNYYISYLKEKGIIKKKGYGVWEVSKKLSNKNLLNLIKKRSKKNLSIGKIEKPTTNLHALQIRFPILEGKVLSKEWEIRNKLNNWLPKYKHLDILEGLTIRNNNNKSITVFAKSRNLENLEEVYNLAFKIRSYMFEYFKDKEGVILDVFNCETKNLDLGTEDKQSEGMLRKGEKFKLNLNKKAEKIFKKDKIDAKAWLDGSPFNFTAETNDLEWKRNYLQMPFNIRDIRTSMFLMKEYNKNLKLHTKVQESQLKTLKSIAKIMGNVLNENKRLKSKNRSLGEFI